VTKSKKTPIVIILKITAKENSISFLSQIKKTSLKIRLKEAKIVKTFAKEDEKKFIIFNDTKIKQK